LKSASVVSPLLVNIPDLIRSTPRPASTPPQAAAA
jgi:hypothetical protein